MRIPWRTTERTLPWFRSYFEHLQGDFALHPPDPDAVRRIASKTADEVTETEIYELNQAVLASQSLSELLAAAPVLRLKYKETVGSQLAAIYRPVDLPSGADEETIKTALLADLSTIVSSLHLHYAIERHIQRLQNNITRSVVVMVLIYTALWGALSVWVHWYIHAPLAVVTLTVIYAGIIGGFISSLERMQSIDTGLDPLLIVEQLDNVYENTLWLSPLLGGVFAAVLMSIFISGMVSGVLFPSFVQLNGPLRWDTMKLLSPDKSIDFAKLFVWSFIAGFAERFVPDTLDRVIERGNQAIKSAAPPPEKEAPPLVVAPPPPAAGSVRMPANGEKNVARHITVRWIKSAAAGATYDLKLGKANPPADVIFAGTADTSRTMDLDAATTYFWQVVAHEGAQVVPGPVWSFTTAV